jgi:acid phosphatase
MQNAAEYRALTSLVYQTATSNLGMAIEDSYWTAYPNQEGREFQQKTPAIILDVDETVLNNAPFQARMIKQNSGFDPEQWNSWVMEAKADPVPGALTFTKRADKEGIAVFYLTNREAKVEAGTRENLKKLGFPLPEGEDRILSNKERENWTSAKTNRRAFVAENHRILMFFGDDLNDFISAKGISQQKRRKLIEEHQDKWGRQWYVLPNPVYGSWENALYDFDNSLSPIEIDNVKNVRLNTKYQ